jgi:hypothetical protein
MAINAVKYQSNFATGLRFITSASGSAVSSISINNCFSASFSHYLVMRDFLSSSANNNVSLRLRASSTDDSAANYRRQQLDADSTSIAGARATGETSWVGALGITETTSMGFARWWISNPFEAVRTTAWVDASYLPTGNIQSTTRVYEHDTASSYDGFTAIPGAGTITGTIYVYGLREAQ